MKTLRRITLLLAGFLFTLFLIFMTRMYIDKIIPRSTYLGSWPINYWLSAFIGGFFTGHLIRKKGWLYGLFVGIFTEVWNMVPAFVRVVKGAPFVGMVVGGFFDLFEYIWLFRLGTLIAGTAGGIFGQFVAKQLHKSPHN